ncbi:MAG: hypothetical protein JSS71_08470 [Armatimonadetes bacterium]|nr:hypothetical protein [Armatimonadota bacterium]MBX3109702.1 hypothetical protein [Fimbriimonadaceae bacterium]
MKTLGKNKGLLTVVCVGLLVGAAVSAQASGFQSGAEAPSSTIALIPLLAAVSFAVARKRA